MLKFGFNSDQQKEMIETTMKQANVQPTLHLFNEYLTILKIEGHDTEAQRVVDEDMMKTMKIEPNDHHRLSVHHPRHLFLFHSTNCNNIHFRLPATRSIHSTCFETNGRE